MTHLDDHTLFDLALGTGDHEHLATCDACKASLTATLEALHLLALGPGPAPPPASLRVRLLAAVAGPSLRHSARAAALLGLPHALVAAALARVDADNLEWLPLLPTLEIHSFPALDGRERGLLRAAAGTIFPHHGHLGEEHVLVLQGSCRDSLGHHLGPGDEVHHTAGTAHHLEIHPGPALVFAYLSDGADFSPAPP